MGQMYETVKQIEAVIAKKGLPQFRMKGLIAIRVGFALSLVSDKTPDDPAKIAALRAAAKEVLGEPVT
jgi:hypothetical protein